MIDKAKRTLCEVYSRVCGYIRPVVSFNDSKQAEFSERKVYKTKTNKIKNK